MRFNPKAGIDQSQIETRGGGSAGGSGMRMPIPGGGGGRIGLGTIVIVILYVVITQFTGGGGNGGGGDTATTNTCRTGADANESEACATDLFTNSVQDFWTTAYPEQENGAAYEPIKTVRYSGSTSSKCGTASADVGPFYCPNDRLVYLDTTFFRDMLEGQLGAKGGTFAIGYVIAHEYGHHIQDQLGVLGKIRTQNGPKSDAVRVELMADCLAGVWAKGAETTQDSQGQTLIEGLNQDDVSRAIDAAQAVGDDRIQKRSSGSVNPDTFTHGSAAQRMRWFNQGMKQGTIQGCDTFATDSL